MLSHSLPSKKPAVTSRLQTGKLLVEIYSDGDCLIEAPGILGPHQWSREFVRELALACKVLPATPAPVINLPVKSRPAVKNTKTKRKSDSSPKEVAKSSRKKSQGKPKAAASLSCDRGDYRRKISALGPAVGYQEDSNKRTPVNTENAWEVVFTHRKTLTVIKHSYLNRGFARKGRVEVPLGSEGRIA